MGKQKKKPKNNCKGNIKRLCALSLALTLCLGTYSPLNADAAETETATQFHTTDIQAANRQEPESISEDDEPSQQQNPAIETSEPESAASQEPAEPQESDIPTQDGAGTATSPEQESQDYTIECTIDSAWAGAFNASVRITNNTDTAVEDWTLCFSFTGAIANIWCAQIQAEQDGFFLIKNAGYNASVAPGQTVSFGFTADGDSETDVPGSFCLNPQSFPLEGANPEPGNTQPEKPVPENPDTDTDTDGDGLFDTFEKTWGLNPENPDTDGDGLSDYVEIYMTFTDPLLPDTDGNGINDGEEDLDGDGLSNLQEISLGTSLTDTDTDGDGLCDGEEVLTHGTDPLQKDTDGDGLSDYDDIFLGFSPLLADTDQNGIPDGEERVFQSVEQEFPAEEGNGLTKVGVSMDTAGNLEANMEILNMNQVDLLSSGVAGLIGVPVEINAAAAFETAQLTFYYDEASLGDAREEDLAILWYDKANNCYQVLDSAVDTENNTVTYATTHFSTYMLVNLKAWRDTWKTTMISKDKPKGESEKSFDIVIIVETDTALAKVPNYLVEFIDTLQQEDEAAIVSFVGNQLIAGSFTSNKLALKNQINSLESNIGVNEDIALAKAVELLAERDSGKQGVILWVSDGYFNYNQTTVDSCIRQSIPVYTVALLGYGGNQIFQNTGEPIGYNNLMKLSLLTGGKCYPGERGGWHNSLMPELHGNEINIPDTKDSDGDGLTDSLEMAGIQLPNGVIVYTDPYKADTDGDGLTDFQETGAPHKESNMYLGGDTYAITVIYPSMKSNPVSVDSDGDGKNDNVDEHPWIMCHETVALLGNRYEDVEYLKIKLLPYSNDNCLTDKANPYLNGSEALYSAGGSQNWWDDLGNDQWEFDLFDSPGSQYYRLHYMGCGVTAMCDMELYMAQQNPGYHTTCGTVIYDEETGIIQREDYRRYVETGYAFTYEIPHISFMDIGLGLLPDKMVEGMHTFLWANHHPFTHIEWAPYPLLGKEDRKKAVLNRIKDMLDKNIPVVFSYYRSDQEDEINMYYELEDAENKVPIQKWLNGYMTNGHYMTITGLYRYLEDSPETGLHYEYILKAVSWGGVYYIRYDEYAANLDLFNNILAVY